LARGNRWTIRKISSRFELPCLHTHTQTHTHTRIHTCLHTHTDDDVLSISIQRHHSEQSLHINIILQ